MEQWEAIVGIAVAGVGVAWRFLSGRRKRQLRQAERAVKSYAGHAFRAIEVMAAIGNATGYSPLRSIDKLTEYKGRIHRWLDAHPEIPTSFDDIEKKAEVWADDWAVDAKLDTDTIENLRRLTDLASKGTP